MSRINTFRASGDADPTTRRTRPHIGAPYDARIAIQRRRNPATPIDARTRVAESKRRQISLALRYVTAVRACFVSTLRRHTRCRRHLRRSPGLAESWPKNAKIGRCRIEPRVMSTTEQTPLCKHFKLRLPLAIEWLTFA
jgi:hypothetical protein